MKLEKLPNTTLCLVEDRDNYRSVHVALDSCTNGLQIAHLYLVTLTRHFDETYRKLPVVSHYYVMAQTPDDAIKQVECNAFPDNPGGWLDDAERALLSATATQIPFQIRGWSRETF